MGKGIALMFRQAYPENYERYRAAAERGEIRTGRMFVVENTELIGPRWIINFPTKQHWRHASRLERIEAGLDDLRRVISEYEIDSVAIPPLGCGNGGLEWELVRSTMETKISDLEGVEIVLYEPTPKYQNSPKRDGVEKLTPARALMAEAVRRYEVLGFEGSNLEAQKLAWFLERAIALHRLDNPLNLRFAAGRYGPYADRLRHLLDRLDGTYLQSEKRLADAGPADPIRFNRDRAEEVDEYMRSAKGSKYSAAIEHTSQVIEGFESPLGMELLATVDWLVAREKTASTVEGIRSGITKWPGGEDSAERKQRLFKDSFIHTALDRLRPWGLVPNSPKVAHYDDAVS